MALVKLPTRERVPLLVPVGENSLELLLLADAAPPFVVTGLVTLLGEVALW